MPVASARTAGGDGASGYGTTAEAEVRQMREAVPAVVAYGMLCFPVPCVLPVGQLPTFRFRDFRRRASFVVAVCDRGLHLTPGQMLRNHLASGTWNMEHVIRCS